jgi:hypothetical protein
MAALTIIIVGWCAQERGSRRRFQRLASLTCGNARPVHRLRETWRNEWIAPAARLPWRFCAPVVREVRMRQSISKAEFDCAQRRDSIGGY